MVVDTTAMNRILSVDTVNGVAVAQPGAITKALRDAAAGQGLFYPPDPASFATCTLGGNAATNAGGPACVKYGVTRDYVLGLTAVLPDGEIIKAGVATRKGVVATTWPGCSWAARGRSGSSRSSPSSSFPTRAKCARPWRSSPTPERRWPPFRPS